MKLKDLLQKRAKIVADLRGMWDKADVEKRGLNTEEVSQEDSLNKELDQVEKRIETEERLQKYEKETPESEETRGKETAQSKAAKPRATEEYRDAFGAYLRRGLSGLAPHEVRALSAGNLAEGGALIPSEQFVNDLIKAVMDPMVVFDSATKQLLEKAVSLGCPTLDADPADADWTSELGTGSEDSTMAFGKRVLEPKPLAKRIKVSNKLLQNAVVGAEAVVLERLAYKVRVAAEKAFMTGNGATQPLGLFTAHASGISSSRDVVTGSATDYTFDGLIDVQMSVKPQYRAKAKWLFHRDGVKKVRKLKDTTNQYLWQPSNQVGVPATLLGNAVNESEYVPNTFTTGLYVGMYGDLSMYWIAIALEMVLQRLVELYAETNQVGFIIRAEMDGMPVLEEAFARIKLS
jgi:HK97 family phage major capsid protein